MGDSSPTRRFDDGRRGFTLVELLVVIAIIGILIAMLLPAVQSAREAARRMSCVNHLKQLALAVHNYESSTGLLPPSGIVELESISGRHSISGKYTYDLYQQQKGLQISWAVILLPYIEEQNLYDQFDLSTSIFAQPDEPTATPVAAYMCPSDAARGRFFRHAELTGGQTFSKGNYAAYCSPFHTDLQLAYPGALVARGQPLSRVIDGSNYTIVFSELRTRDHLEDERGAWALPWNAASLLAYDMHHDSGNHGVASNYVPLPKYDYQTQFPNAAGPNLDILQKCPDAAGAQLEGMPCGEFESADGGISFRYLSAAPRSNHHGGVNAVYLDGHVGFLTDDIDIYLMAYLTSTNDGQITSGDTGFRPSDSLAQ